MVLHEQGAGGMGVQVSQGVQSRQIPVGRVWDCEDNQDLCWLRCPGQEELLSYRNKLLKTAQERFRNESPIVCSWKMKSGKTGNKGAASSVCHRLISTIECESNHGPAVPLCVTVLGVAGPGWSSSIPAKTSGQPK